MGLSPVLVTKIYSDKCLTRPNYSGNSGSYAESISSSAAGPKQGSGHAQWVIDPAPKLTCTSASTSSIPQIP
jgi:hypothetical protein